MNDTSPIVPSRIKTLDPLHEPRQLTAAQREVFRRRSQDSRERREAALAGEGGPPLHDINIPRLDPLVLMPQLSKNDVPTLSLFSGGGGLDLGFERAGFKHEGSWEWMAEAAKTLETARPDWTVFGGDAGDVQNVDWRPYRGNVGVIHGGPPCQPFSNAGKRRGALDPRDMWPEFVRSVLTVRPEAFVAENVAALASSKFSDYVDSTILSPLGKFYHIKMVTLQAFEFGVPQVRKRVFFFGFRNKALFKRWSRPEVKFALPGDDSASDSLLTVMGAREALGLPDTGYDAVLPTIRSGLSGPRHTTSILSSVSAQKRFEALEIWPNGVAATREAASAFVAKNGHFRLSVPDVALLQGFPADWRFSGAVYMQLGQIGNSVAPPVAYAVAKSVSQALAK